MSLMRFLKNLLSSSEPRRRSGPTPPKSSEDYAKEIETEKELGKGRRYGY